MLTTKADQVISLLVSSVGKKPARELVKTCRDIGMEEQPYQNLGADGVLAEFDRGYHFIFSPEDGLKAVFEVLEKNNEIVQAGFQASYRSGIFSSPVKKHFQDSNTILEALFGTGQQIKTSGAEMINYSGQQTVAYCSKMKSFGCDILTVRFGNRRLC